MGENNRDKIESKLFVGRNVMSCTGSLTSLNFFSIKLVSDDVRTTVKGSGAALHVKLSLSALSRTRLLLYRHH